MTMDFVNDDGNRKELPAEIQSGSERGGTELGTCKRLWNGMRKDHLAKPKEGSCKTGRAAKRIT